MGSEVFGFATIVASTLALHRESMANDGVDDPYEQARRIASRLDLLGLAADAHSLRNAIEEGGTGTETFMRLRHALTHILSAPNVEPDLLVRLHELHRQLDNALK